MGPTLSEEPLGHSLPRFESSSPSDKKQEQTFEIILKGDLLLKLVIYYLIFYNTLLLECIYFLFVQVIGN